MFVFMFDILIFVIAKMESDCFVIGYFLIRIILRIGLRLGWRLLITWWIVFGVSLMIVMKIFFLVSISRCLVRLIGILGCGCRSIVCILCLFHLHICLYLVSKYQFIVFYLPNQP